MENKSIIKVIIIGILSIIIWSSISLLAFADIQDNLDGKLNNQNKDIQQNINPIPDFKLNDKFIDSVSKSMKDTDGVYKGELVSKGKKILMGFTVHSREYAIYVYIVVMMLDIVIIAYFGSKSIELRRKYTLRGIYGTIAFLFFINVPLFMYYFQNRTDQYKSEEVLQMLNWIITFLNGNALIICFLVYLMGVFNNIASDNDVVAKLKSKFLKKIAIISYIILKLLPITVNIFI